MYESISRLSWTHTHTRTHLKIKRDGGSGTQDPESLNYRFIFMHVSGYFLKFTLVLNHRRFENSNIIIETPELAAACVFLLQQRNTSAAGQVLRCPQGEHTEGRRSGSHMFITSLWRVNQSQWVQSRTNLPQIKWRMVNSDGERRKLTKWLYCHETTSWQEASADLWPLLPAGKDITCPTRVCPQIKTKY